MKTLTRTAAIVALIVTVGAAPGCRVRDAVAVKETASPLRAGSLIPNAPVEKSKIQKSTIQKSTVKEATAQDAPARNPTMQRSTAQSSTAQSSTAQSPPVQRPTAQKVTPQLEERSAAEPLPQPITALPLVESAFAAPNPVSSSASSETLSSRSESSDSAKVVEVREIDGKVSIEFNSRIAALRGGDLAATTSVDRYTVDLQASNSLQVRGNIFRDPRIISSILGREQRPLTYRFDLNLSEKLPSAESASSIPWSGSFMVSRSGEYQFTKSFLLGAGKPVFGRVIGRAEQQSSALKNRLREYTRILPNRSVKVVAKEVDPIRLDNLSLPGGPGNYPPLRIVGSFDFDYETGNWYAAPLTFNYTEAGVTRTDTITGSIKWIEDPNRATNGRGYYEFNLRLNEAAAQGVGAEDEFFQSKKLSDEEAFFAIDNSLPGIFGEVQYQDSFDNSGEKPTVIQSEVLYRLKAHGFSATQLANFLKFWVFITGPVNDE